MLLSPVDLGPVELHTGVGAGGMGQGWRGVHRATGVPVAVKVIRSPERSGRRFTLAFRNEVRQVAKLDHPHVVRILDDGEVDDVAAAASNDQLRAGSPFFVMEYASAGSLADHLAAPIDWEGVRSALVALLSGLAHAHARGVLHRDLSPRNILLAGPGDPRPGLKLADFGLARGELASSALVDGGTPQYMPPEQFDRRVHEQGPWTDLYALGCIAWELVTGAPLFTGRTTRDLHRQHVSAPIPPLVTRFDAPPDLERWLVRLVQKDPAARFRYAADAIAALGSLGPAVPTVSAVPGGGSTIEASGAFELPAHDEAPTDVGLPHPGVAPIVPTHWRPRLGERRHPLVGIGLGLYELRTLPLVDRFAAGDALWDALRAAWDARRPQLRVVCGPTGHGKTHLARSVGWRAQELCAAELVIVEHGPVVGPTHGVRYGLATALGCVGLAEDEVDAQVRLHLARAGLDDPDERAALVRYLVGSELMLIDEQDALAVRVLARLGADRPVVVRLEGLQWGPETVRFALAVLAARGPLPVLLIGTVDPPGEVDPRLVGRDDTAVIEIGPLADADQLTLVRELLHLDDGLAERVVHRTRGSPLFAERLVGDWVRRDRLGITPRGYTLRDGTPDELPDDLHQVWIRAIERAVRGEAATTALFVGCALGLEPSRQDWVDGCARSNVPESAVDELADALCAARLAEPAGAGWRFAHPLVWESVRRRAIDAGAWAEVNRACAAMLADRPGEVRQQERLGGHLLAAGRLDESLEPLLAGARRCVDAGEFPAAQALLDRRDAAMRALRVPDDDERWGDGRLVELRVLVGRGAVVQAQARGAELAEACRVHRWKRLLPEALRALGLSLLKLGKLLDAEAMFALAGSTASLRPTRDAQLTQARCAMYRGTILRIRGSLADALEVLEASLAQFEALGDRTGIADCEAEIAHARLVLAGELDLAEAAIGRAQAAYGALGNQVGVATCVNTAGDIHRRRGDLAGAERAYRWALARFDRLGSDARLFPRLNLGMVLLALGQVAEADAYFAEAQDLIERSGRAGLLAAVRICRLPGAAIARDWATWDARLAAADGQVHRADPDLAAVLDQAAALAEAAGQSDRAEAAKGRASALRSA
ncbi:MAG: protein kinase [Myxococcota bacterium]